MPDYSYIGSGRAYLEEIGANAGMFEVGNASSLSLAVTEDVKESRDFTQAGGGTYNEVRRIQSVEASITMSELSPRNLARALLGNTSADASAVIASESVLCYPDAFSPFAKLPASTPSVTVAPPATTARAATAVVALNARLIPVAPNGFYYKVTTAGTTGSTVPTFPTTIGATVVDGTATLTCAGRTSLVSGTDYELRPSGLYVLPGRTIAGEPWLVGYTSVAADIVQALTTSTKEYRLVFDGLNEARSGKRSRILIHRLKLGAAQSIGLLGEDFAALELSGKLLKDTSISGAGLSQYTKIDIEA